MAVLAGEALALALWRQLLSIHRQEVEVRREGTEKVQNVVAAIISDDALTLDRGAQLHCLIFLVQHAVPLDLKCTPSIWKNSLKESEYTVSLWWCLYNQYKKKNRS